MPADEAKLKMTLRENIISAESLSAKSLFSEIFFRLNLISAKSPFGKVPFQL
jgi:hypothetical protein